MTTTNTPLNILRHHVTGAIERGEAQPIVEQTCDSKKANKYGKFNGLYWLLLTDLEEIAAKLTWWNHGRTQEIVHEGLAKEDGLVAVNPNDGYHTSTIDKFTDIVESEDWPE